MHLFSRRPSALNIWGETFPSHGAAFTICQDMSIPLTAGPFPEEDHPAATPASLVSASRVTIPSRAPAPPHHHHGAAKQRHEDSARLGNRGGNVKAPTADGGNIPAGKVRHEECPLTGGSRHAIKEAEHGGAGFGAVHCQRAHRAPVRLVVDQGGARRARRDRDDPGRGPRGGVPDPILATLTGAGHVPF